MNKKLEVRRSIGLLAKAGCLELLLKNGIVTANCNGFISRGGAKGPRGGSILKYLKTAVNDIVSYENDSLSRIPAAEIDFANSTLQIKEEYQDAFRNAVQAYL